VYYRSSTMKHKFTALLPRKKVTLRDIASPEPSRAARRVINYSLRQAYKDQKIVKQKARALRAAR